MSPIALLQQIDILATPGTVAFCPGTHEYFGRPPCPLVRFRRAGVPVCVAADSAASNTGLSMTEEMRRLARSLPRPSGAEIVAAATISARRIGWGDDIGEIEPGSCPGSSAWSPYPDAGRLDRTWFES